MTSRSEAWNAHCYDSRHSFVFKYGEDLLPLLDAKQGERILDLGCGTGHLTAHIARSGANVSGIDNSESMIAEAKKNYSNIDFRVADARDFDLGSEFDAVFSNAALHWMPQADAVVKRVAKCLKPGGRFVAEMGGKGNVEHILSTTRQTLGEMGFADAMPIVWYYPSLGRYASLLEDHGFRVSQAFHFDRPTPLEGPSGLRQWLSMFKVPHFRGVSADVLPELFERVEKKLYPILCKNGTWTADYVRLRFLATKNV